MPKPSIIPRITGHPPVIDLSSTYPPKFVRRDRFIFFFETIVDCDEHYDLARLKFDWVIIKCSLAAAKLSNHVS